MSEVVNYKCPACTAPMRFDGEEQKLVCDYCGNTYTVDEVENFMKEKEKKAEDSSEKKDEWDTSKLTNEWGEEGKDLSAYNCPSCGAELITDKTTVATSCPYCGNPTVVPSKVSGMLKPDYVLPFKLSKEEAMEGLKNFYKGKKLLPDVFEDENKIQEIKGVYVPFWLFRGVARGTLQMEGTKTNVYISGDYEVTETNYYDVTRGGSAKFEKIPVDASSKMPDEFMDSIEPFDYIELKDFSTAYLPGYYADKYDLEVEDCSDRADLRAENTLTALLESEVSGYDSLRILDSNINISRGEVSYALMPVYMLTTKWNDEIFLFAMNGQTGKFTGKLPIDEKKFWRYFFKYLLIAGFIAAVVIYFIVKNMV